MLISGIIGVALIVVTGYLIIYNIFQISVIQDIQSYGQLKTLGTTRRQIKRLINRQALRLSPDWYSHRPAGGLLHWPGLSAFPDERNELYRRHRY